MHRARIKFFRSTREGWRHFHSDTKAAKQRCRYADEDFAAMFPGGHDYSLRDMALASYDPEFLKKLDERRPGHSLRDIHPEALQLLVAYGTDYSPYLFGVEAYNEKLQPVMGACFQNAHFLMCDRNRVRESERHFMYVEGIAYGVMVQPILHAWNTTKSSPDKAVDWTLYPSTKWLRHYGIAFTAEEFKHIHRVSNASEGRVSLLHQDRFEFIEKGLREVLSERETNPGPTP